MAAYCIIETDDGLTVVEHPDGMTAEQTAHQHGGVVIDSGPYTNYDDACDALTALQMELEDEEASETPGTQALEGRYEVDD